MRTQAHGGSKEDYGQVRAVVSYMEKNLEEPMTAGQAASVCSYSLSNMKVLFHKIFQCGMMDYMNRRKVTEAAGELPNTDKTVCEIAIKYGFASPEVFGRVFKRVWQENPSRFRRSRRFWGVFPRQEFHCDESGVVRKRCDLKRLRSFLGRRDRTYAVCFDLLGIRALKTEYGWNGGERFVLECLQRIEAVMGDGDELVRIAGDKFVLVLGTGGHETAREKAGQVLRRNGEEIGYKGGKVPLAMFAGTCCLSAEDAHSELLFERLDGVIRKAHGLIERKMVQGATESRHQLLSDGRDFARIRLEGVQRYGEPGNGGYFTLIEEESTRFSFRLDGQGEVFSWASGRQDCRVVFPDGQDWFVMQVMDGGGHTVREHYCVMRNLSVQAASGYVDKTVASGCFAETHETVITCEKLMLEAVREIDGKWLMLNEGEVKEFLFDGKITPEEYQFIRRAARKAQRFPEINMASQFRTMEP